MTSATATSAAAATFALGTGAVFLHATMARISYVTSAVSGLIGLKMIERSVSALRHWPSVPVTRIITVINVAVEASRSAKPGAGSNENSAVEPVWPIVPVGRAIVG